MTCVPYWSIRLNREEQGHDNAVANDFAVSAASMIGGNAFDAALGIVREAQAGSGCQRAELLRDRAVRLIIGGKFEKGYQQRIVDIGMGANTADGGLDLHHRRTIAITPPP